jgi:hypothetical protein
MSIDFSDGGLYLWGSWKKNTDYRFSDYRFKHIGVRQRKDAIGEAGTTLHGKEHNIEISGDESEVY